MIPIKINDINTLIPTNWHEVTISQFIELLKADKFIKKLSILTGIDYHDIMNADDVDLDQKLLPFLDYLTKPTDYEAWKVPEYISTSVYPGARKIKVPKDLDMETFGQKITYQQMEQAEINKQRTLNPGEDMDFTTLIIPVLAVYFQPLYHEEKFNDDKVDDFMEVVAKIPCDEAWPTAFFLFRKYSALKDFMGLALNQMKRYRLINWLRKRALKSLRSLERLELSTALRQEYPGTMKK